MNQQEFTTPWGKVGDTASAFRASARYHQDAELLALANNGMRPLSVGNYGNRGCDTVVV